ncbi:MAG: 16S rRNA (cytidine(1402)-2'-O)-methyltransferase, partial [Chloroflexota bacterium]|nr:16S rRNA (cytidine(1402)-2'-O)-methyltransferase [Chloroflexota bacterium]
MTARDAGPPGSPADGAVASGGRSSAHSGRGGTLYVVATPIGNLNDITLRALEVLRSVPLVAAEDTRLTRRLWARHGLSTRLVSYHARNARAREPELLAHLADGHDLGLVTDAGTPLVSDPGEGLVVAWASAGGRIVPIPGASAVLAALVASGIPAPRWSFEGFLPRRGRERRDRLERMAADERASVLFEAAGRTAATLRDLAATCGAARGAAVCRELTKLHEEVRRGTLEALARGAEEDPPRGEVSIVVAGAPRSDPSGTAAARSDASAAASASRSDPSAAAATALVAARRRVQDLVDEGLTRSAAARRVAQETGLPRREL